ncbi:hypothetical protein IQ266_19450 [filamentous cyanobacterium LEGE 11480]|uniref:Uncharacterized protein n=1 Tax=Romeriopsis navalis LEGE 11480 TaxID=2777977 RepID=A0A928VSU6_9CYAN|nr:hypothetical protein [Romeriopsis navalis]MBE9031915.1 hypothetical protein [Romeriopsis navalis LEGE 11480]
MKPILNHHKPKRIRPDQVRVGRFFSLQQGRVGQFLSPRVLLVRKPFQHQVVERCYFGFDSLYQAWKFTEKIAHNGCYFRLDRSRVMPQRYEIEIFNPGEIARLLAFWDRHEAHSTPSDTSINVSIVA